MALGLYFDAEGTDRISEGTGANPDTALGNGTDGFTDEKQLYIMNDDPTREYKAVGEQPAITITADGDDAVAGVNVMYAPDNAGAPGTYAEYIDLPDGGYTTPTPFWRKLIVDPGTPEQNVVTIKHKVEGQRFVV